MLVTDAIKLIRKRINDEFDTGYSEDFLINVINNAIKYLSSALIARSDPTLAKDITVTTEGTKVPKNFVRFAGGYPIRRSGDTFQLVVAVPEVYARYFYIPDDITSDGELPFGNNETYNMLIINLAGILAMNLHEYDIQQDNAIQQQMEQIITQALGAVE